MLSYNELKLKNIILFNGEPHKVLSTHVFRKQQRKPVNQVKLRNIISGGMAEHTFHVSDKIEEAEVSNKNVTFIYHRDGEWWFHEESDKGARFALSDDTIGDNGKWLKGNMTVEALVFNDAVVDITLPIKLELLVKDAPPNVKGNTAQGGNKPVVLETGAIVTTPMFIESGDTIEVNTETGEYCGRVSK
jgi:elongation factor P